jgi:hypothetical protein
MMWPSKIERDRALVPHFAEEPAREAFDDERLHPAISPSDS